MARAKNVRLLPSSLKVDKTFGTSEHEYMSHVSQNIIVDYTM
jgi:hypothetical protein